MTLLPSVEKEKELQTAHDHDQHEDHRIFGLIAFLVADGMTFAGFFAAYLTFKAVNPISPDSIYELELALPTINTVLLLISSATFHRAAKALKKSDSKLCQRWLAITASLGLAFLASQMIEYFTLPFGLTDNLFASTFYTVTGFHGLHVTLGTIMILIIWWQSREIEGRININNQFPLEATELYWHFVDGIWVILFIIFYLL